MRVVWQISHICVSVKDGFSCGTIWKSIASVGDHVDVKGNLDEEPRTDARRTEEEIHASMALNTVLYRDG